MIHHHRTGALAWLLFFLLLKICWQQHSVVHAFVDSPACSLSSFRRDTSKYVSATSSFDWETEWYPLAPVQDLTRNGPNKLTLLGMDLAIWYHAPSKQWRAFADICPHRRVPLSEGRIEPEAGVLQCAYHGWIRRGRLLCENSAAQQ